MKKEIAEKWVAALRSGRYKQGRCALLKDGKFCCLGVLCDVHRQEVGGKWLTPAVKELTRALAYEAEPGDVPECDLLPLGVMVWAGANYGSPRVASDNIANLNDSQGKTFEEIADLIEKHYEEM